METAKYCYIITMMQIDFIGKVANEDNDSIELEDPMESDYVGGVPDFTTNFMPVGVDVSYGQGVFVRVPKQNIAYCVMLSEEQDMVKRYLEALYKTGYISSTASTNWG